MTAHGGGANPTGGGDAFWSGAERRLTAAAAKGRRGTRRRSGAHDPPPASPARANTASVVAHARRREVAHALHQGRLGFIELRELVKAERPIAHMKLKVVLRSMEWDTSRLTQWRLSELEYDPTVALGHVGRRQWAILISAWPMPNVKRSAVCLSAVPMSPRRQAAERAAGVEQEAAEQAAEQERRLAGWKTGGLR